MKTSDYDYDLPERLIAQSPALVRDHCRLLVMDKRTGEIEDKHFYDIIDYLNPGDVLIANETRVMPARLLGHKQGTGGAAEVFLLKEIPSEVKDSRHARWETLVKPGKRLKPGAVIECRDEAGDVALTITVVDWSDGERGERICELSTTHNNLEEALHAVGNTPLPPYIKNYTGDKEMYQTVYATTEKSAAAPTAGLHFTPELIKRIQDKGVIFKTVELQVGLDTFRIVEEENAEDHQMHTERYTVSEDVVRACDEAHARGNKVIAVGTTSVRSLESAWDADAGVLRARTNEATSLYLLPGSTFHVVDAMITNFHVPRSTLMMLVSAFSSREFIMNAYKHAISEEYRMLSFGDAMYMH